VFLPITTPFFPKLTVLASPKGNSLITFVSISMLYRENILPKGCLKLLAKIILFSFHPAT